MIARPQLSLHRLIANWSGEIWSNHAVQILVLCRTTGRVLFLQRAHDVDSEPDTLGFPIFGLELGEDPHEGIIRAMVGEFGHLGHLDISDDIHNSSGAIRMTTHLVVVEHEFVPTRTPDYQSYSWDSEFFTREHTMVHSRGAFNHAALEVLNNSTLVMRVRTTYRGLQAKG